MLKRINKDQIIEKYQGTRKTPIRLADIAVDVDTETTFSTEKLNDYLYNLNIPNL